MINIFFSFVILQLSICILEASLRLLLRIDIVANYQMPQIKFFDLSYANFFLFCKLSDSIAFLF